MFIDYLKRFRETRYLKESAVIITQDYIDFVEYLKKFNIPVDKYGTEKFKTVNHLFNEIKEGETVLTEEGGKLVRRVNFVGARIIFKKDGRWQHLYEEKQVFKDGRIRRRNLPYSMAEKFKLGEDPKKVLIRGFKEELNIELSMNQFNFYNRVEIEDNTDYPGIISYHTGYEFLVVLNESQFKEEGYIEKQTDKDVYFKWKTIGNRT